MNLHHADDSNTVCAHKNENGIIPLATRLEARGSVETNGMLPILICVNV